ncbi:O-antigen ligase [Magnetospirillum sp. UT-4]|uniref:O-antigen ligase family protein n=1 Tax=Magnetospirillum sp. UT-4 TaxID=2681467 RepID=UPI0013809FC5|nr:O-antigen ligase family protein [Magnetospirillum sp. UT-4]CAA7625477.1 membrane hypothetical protein [Magnetospirillum sp. UT-4]
MDAQAPAPRPAVIAAALVAVAAFAVSLMIAAASDGSAAWAALPLVPVALMWSAPLLAGLLRGRPWAWMLALALLIFVTDASFRARPWADKSVDWQVLLKAAVWAGCGLAGLLRLGAGDGVWKRPPAVLTLAFIGLLGASAAWSPTPLYTLQSAVAFGWLFLFGLAAAEVLDETRLLQAVALGCGLIVLPSLAMAPFAYGLAPSSPGSTGDPDRLRGLTDHPIPMAEIAVLFTFAVLALAGRVRAASVRIGLVVLALAGAAAVLLTQSRVAPVAMLAAVALYVAYRRGGWLLLLPTLVMLTGAVLAAESLSGFAALLPGDLLELVSRSGSSSEILSLSGRLEIWPYVLGRIGESPLLGHGHAAGIELFRGFTRWRITHAHDLYLQAALYVGLVGLGLLAAAFATQLKVFLAAPSPVRDILLLYTLLKGVTEQSVLSNMPSGSVALWMVTVGLAAVAWRGNPSFPRRREPRGHGQAVGAPPGSPPSRG